jgi:hypothetical protein
MICTYTRDERGSIPIMMAVLTITSLMVIAMLASVHLGLRQSRRSGDSADAVQVADAGINEAVQQLASVAGTSFSRTGYVGSSSYTYTATQDATDPKIWHIDALGTNATGVKRRVYADATGESQFTSPLYVRDLMIVGAGAVLDSYRSGLNATQGCTRKGIISLSDGAHISFTSGGAGSSNCTRIAGIDPTWNYAMDGCIIYGGASMPPTGQGSCPVAPYSSKVATPFPLQTVTSSTLPTTTWTCNASTGSNSLQGGTTYTYTTVNLADGCGINPSSVSSGPIKIYAKNFVIGSRTDGNVNLPTAAMCTVSTAGWAYVDAKSNPAVSYCSGWPQTLQLFVPNGLGGTVKFQNTRTKFWGLIDAPDAAVTLESPQLELWGAMVAGSMNVKSQFSWHFDESLSSLTTGKYSVRNWREAPVS